MPLLAAALDCTHDGQAALRDHMGGAYYDWLVRMFREDLRARGVRAAVKNWGVFKADRSLGYLAASVQEALLLPSLPGVAWNEADWRTPSSDAQTPQAALACMVGVPRSFLPPYVYGTLTAWVHLVNEPTPDWFATDFTLATRFSLLRCAQAGQGFQCRRAVAPTVFSSYFPATMHVL
jgi:hypothetical protein